MSDHDADVAAVLAAAFRKVPFISHLDSSEWTAVEAALAALTATGYAVVKVPEGVTVEHGARLVVSPLIHHDRKWFPAYAIEPPEKGER